MLPAIFSAVSKDFLGYIDTKKTTKENLETLHVILVGVNRVIELRVQGL